MFVKHGCPQRQQSQNLAKYLSPTLWPTKTQDGGGAMSVKYKKYLVDLTVYVWLLHIYHHPFFKYCTLYASMWDGIAYKWTDGQMSGQTNDPINRCPC